MAGIIYYLSLPFLYGLSILPFPLFYLFCDGLYVLLYYVVRYRKSVVLRNLRNSFPEKTDAEIRQICKAFYHYLCDLFPETFKTLTISRKSMLKRCRMTPGAQDVFDRLNKAGKSCVLVMGHYGNWEWAGNTFSLVCKQQLFVVYHPMTNKYFNGLFYRMRTRFGTGLYAMRDTFKEMVRNRNLVSATAFIADQTPSYSEGVYWTKFLNQDTPVFQGTEKIARKLGFPVVYVCVKRIKRGYYTIDAEMLVEEPKQLAEGMISELHTKRLEKDIVEKPEWWLWTHKRWKLAHKAPETATNQ